MESPLLSTDGKEIKTIDFTAWGGFEGFLRDTSNGAGGYAQANLLKRISPFLGKALDMTAVAVSSLPFEVHEYSNGKVGEMIDSSDDWKNEIMCMPNPRRFLFLVASSLCGGKAYVIPKRSGRMIAELQYVAPHTVLPLITTNGLQWFSRASDFGNAGIYSPIIPFPAIKSLDGEESDELPQAEKYKIDLSKKTFDGEDLFDITIKNYNGAVDKEGYRKFLKDILIEQNDADQFTGEMMYFWLPDSDIEIGPAKNHPIGKAMTASQLDADMDNTVSKLMSRSGVAPHLISAKGMPQEKERREMENWLNRFLKGAFESFVKILNADAVSVTKIGSGLDDFKSSYMEIDRQVIEKIGSAFGIPAAVFMSDKAFASEIDPMLRTWYDTGTFILLYHTIQETLNFQLLHQYGYHFTFNLQRIKAFQKDAAAQAAAFRDYSSVKIRPSLVAGILGIQMPEGHEVEELDENYNTPQPAPAVVTPKGGETPPEDLGEEETTKAVTFTLNANEIKDLNLWKEMALRFFHKKKGTAVDFECKYLPENIAMPIREKLGNATNEFEIIRAFEISTTYESPTYAKSADPSLVRVAMALEKLAEKA